MLLSSIELIVGLDPVESARYINAILFGLIVYLSGLILSRYLTYFSTVIVGMLAVLLSPVLFSVAIYAWTEPLFILWTLLYLLLLDSYLKKKSTAVLMLLAIVTGMASLTRYVGLSFTLSGVGTILLLQRSSLRSNLFHILLFSAISVAPLGAWVVRNLAVANTLLGDRDPSRIPLYFNLYLILIKCLNWFVPTDYIAERLQSTRGGFVLGAIAGYLVGTGWPPKNAWRESKTAFYRVGTILLFILFYLVILVAASTLAAYDGINSRLLSPIYVPTVLTVLFIIEQKLAGQTRHISFRVLRSAFILRKGYLVVALLIAWLAMPSLELSHTANQLTQTGLGYNHVSWRTSDTLSYLRSQEYSGGEDSPIYSNDPEAVYIHTGATTISSPEAQGYNSNEPRRSVASIAGAWPSSPTALLVWFHGTDRDHLYEVEDLKRAANISVVARLADGTIYRASAK